MKIKVTIYYTVITIAAHYKFRQKINKKLAIIHKYPCKQNFKYNKQENILILNILEHITRVKLLLNTE